MNEGQIVPLGKPLLDTLERMSCGAVLLDEVGRVLLSNPTAIRMLHEEVGCSPNQIENSDWARNAIKKLLRRSNARFSLNSDAWVTIRREAGRDLVLHAVPIGEAPDVQARTVLIMIDLNKSPQPKSSVLQQMFGLTPAEERLAVQITRGDTPADIARETGVSIATVRSQLAAVFAKTQTGRQAELVALLARVAILPYAPILLILKVLVGAAAEQTHARLARLLTRFGGAGSLMLAPAGLRSLLQAKSKAGHVLPRSLSLKQN